MPMTIKTINSTQAQNNFGSLLEDVSENGTQYLVQRFGRPTLVRIWFAGLSARDSDQSRNDK